MEAPRRYSVSPLHSFVTVPSHREPSFSAAVRSIIAWLTGRQPTPPKSEVQFEQRIVDLLAEELSEAETNFDGDETSLIGDHRVTPDRLPQLQLKRPRRIEDPR
jgi:hypothetical protein